MKTKKHIYLLMLLATVVIAFSCDDALPDELFTKNTYFVKNGWQEFDLPVEDDNTAVLPIYFGISGTSENDKDIFIEIDADPDTLAAYNLDRFKNQTGLYYKELPRESYTYDKSTYVIERGSNKGEGIIMIDLSSIGNIYEEFVLPVKITSSVGEPIGQGKYSKFLARIKFTNEFSGIYSGVGRVKQEGTQYEAQISGVTFSGTSTTSCFFYAGDVTRTNRTDYMNYIIDVTIDDDGNLTLSSNNPDLGLEPEKATLLRKYKKHGTDSRYYIETSTLELKYKYKGKIEDEVINYTYEGTLTKTQNVLIEDYPDVEASEY